MQYIKDASTRNGLGVEYTASDMELISKEECRIAATVSAVQTSVTAVAAERSRCNPSSLARSSAGIMSHHGPFLTTMYWTCMYSWNDKDQGPRLGGLG